MADFQWYWFWFELARSWNWRVLSYRKSTLLIHWLFYYNLMFVLACCFFSSYRADGMSNDSSANVLVSSIHNSMYYLGYVQFFYWLFLSFVSIAKATTIWRRADAIMGYKCFSIPSFQVNDWACSGWSIIWPLWIWVVHECKRCLHHSRHLIHATRLDIIKSFGDVSIYRARGGGGGVDFGGDHMVFAEGETDRGSVVVKRR